MSFNDNTTLIATTTKTKIILSIELKILRKSIVCIFPQPLSPHHPQTVSLSSTRRAYRGTHAQLCVAASNPSKWPAIQGFTLHSEISLKSF